MYVENRAGYYVQPTQYNVAVALTQARIIGCTKGGTCNPHGIPANSYLTQNLDGVYTYKDARTYPLSSYSYMIIPASATDQRMTVPKRQTLADFLSYDLCTDRVWPGTTATRRCRSTWSRPRSGSSEKLGPTAQGGAVAGVHVKNPSANLASCNNPTFVKGEPVGQPPGPGRTQPLACQKATAQPCGDSTVPPGTNSSSGPEREQPVRRTGVPRPAPRGRTARTVRAARRVTGRRPAPEPRDVR